jgi:hypothetical protein
VSRKRHCRPGAAHELVDGAEHALAAAAAAFVEAVEADQRAVVAGDALHVLQVRVDRP